MERPDQRAGLSTSIRARLRRSLDPFRQQVADAGIDLVPIRPGLAEHCEMGPKAFDNPVFAIRDEFLFCLAMAADTACCLNGRRCSF